MKRFVLIAFLFISVYASAQQLTTELQAGKGIFTERLFLRDRWIDRISNDLNSADSLADNVLVTASAIANYARLKSGSPINNQLLAAQPAGFWLQGKAALGAFNAYQQQLPGGLPAQVYINHSSSRHGLSIQRGSVDQGPATLTFFKNNSTGFNTLQAVAPGDSLGSILFSGVAGNGNAVTTASLHARVEKTGPTYISSGYVFNTTDSNGVYAQRMWLNGAGNLLLGSDTVNTHRLNVASGDVRINSLSGEGTVLMGSDNNGVLTKIKAGANVTFTGGVLTVTPPVIIEPFSKYVATVDQTNQNAPTMSPLENTLGNIQWTRTAPGVYTGTLPGAFPEGATWLKSEASDETGHAVFARLSRINANTITLVVKDINQNNIDNWTGISLEIRTFITD